MITFRRSSFNCNSFDFQTTTQEHFMFPHQRWPGRFGSSRTVQQNKCSVFYAGRWGAGHVILRLLWHISRSRSHVQKSARCAASQSPQQRAYDVSHEGRMTDIKWRIFIRFEGSHWFLHFVCFFRQVSNDETLKLLQEESFNMHKIDSNFCEFRFVPRSMDELGTAAAVVAVFRDLGLKESWSINQETLSRLVSGPRYISCLHLLFVLTR